MKALISPEEIYTASYITAWIDGEPQYESIEGCQRVVEVAENTFEVAEPLYWMDCPDDCVADQWYYKDGLHKIPEKAVNPDEPTEE